MLRLIFVILSGHIRGLSYVSISEEHQNYVEQKRDAVQSDILEAHKAQLDTQRALLDAQRRQASELSSLRRDVQNVRGDMVLSSLKHDITVMRDDMAKIRDEMRRRP